jgi:hypothetical protein
MRCASAWPGMTYSRRSLLACCAAGAGLLAGCGYRADAGVNEAGRDPMASPTASPEQRTVNGVEVPVPRSELQRGAAKDAIAAIVDPVFGEDWSGISMEVNTNVGTYISKPRLSADEPVIGVARAGEARAYPLRLLNWHEVVNDEFGGPLLVTYCPLCGSAMTAVRRAAGEETVFGVSGLLYRNDLVMYDRATDSLWSQIIATAIRGELTGETLQLVPSTLTTWGEWQETYPDTVVLRPPPDSGTIGDAGPANYDQYPYGQYRTDSKIGLGGSADDGDGRLHPKTTVIGVERDDAAVAYPLPIVQEAGVVNDTVGNLPVVVAATADGTLVAYVRRVDGEAVPVERADETHLRAAGSRWQVTTGRAVDGPPQGPGLEAANDTSPMFFFAWTDFNAETEVYGVDRGTTVATGTPTPVGWRTR